LTVEPRRFSGGRGSALLMLTADITRIPPKHPNPPETAARDAF